MRLFSGDIPTFTGALLVQEKPRCHCLPCDILALTGGALIKIRLKGL
jgi:hypothetical protein